MNENLNLSELFQLITEWGKEKGILSKDGKPGELIDILTQYAKLQSEMGELGDSIIKHDDPGRRDGMGDVFVVWVMLMNQFGYNPEEEVRKVYDIISKRKGKMVGNAFVKEGDASLK